jgi:xyloglucan fucosyltransferase
MPDTRDRLLGGLLSPDFEDGSCLSRYRASLYRRPSLHNLSSHLVSRLRRYESHHRLCGPGTPAYSRAVARLRDSNSSTTTSSDTAADDGAKCRYIVWIPQAGLGNRVISTAAAFLYALLTDRVLLVHHPADLDDIFCEPFPGPSTWVLPEKDFPIPDIDGFSIRTPESLGNAVGRHEAYRDPPPPWMYVHLQNNYNLNDGRFFCNDGQDAVHGVRWLLLRSDNYFVPGLFLVPRFEQELDRLFPRRDAVFHHLGRYLIHPSNTVWAMVARYHSSYLAPAEERVGIQVRDFKFVPISADDRYGQIISCAHREGILPAVVDNVSSSAAPDDRPETTTKRKAVLVVSLRGEYYDKLSSLYYELGAAGGGAVSVFQPTHLGAQHTEERHHNQKAFAEMVLLSFSDVVITSAASTFGYVSQGLAGLRPWVLMTPVGGKAPEPPCRLAPTIEPCFHNAPQFECKTRKRGDSGGVVPHVRHCEDYPSGIQLLVD